MARNKTITSVAGIVDKMDVAGLLHEIQGMYPLFCREYNHFSEICSVALSYISLLFCMLTSLVEVCVMCMFIWPLGYVPSAIKVCPSRQNIL